MAGAGAGFAGASLSGAGGTCLPLAPGGGGGGWSELPEAEVLRVSGICSACIQVRRMEGGWVGNADLVRLVQSQD